MEPFYIVAFAPPTGHRLKKKNELSSDTSEGDNIDGYSDPKCPACSADPDKSPRPWSSTSQHFMLATCRPIERAFAPGDGRHRL